MNMLFEKIWVRISLPRIFFSSQKSSEEMTSLATLGATGVGAERIKLSSVLRSHILTLISPEAIANIPKRDNLIDFIRILSLKVHVPGPTQVMWFSFDLVLTLIFEISTKDPSASTLNEHILKRQFDQIHQKTGEICTFYHFFGYYL